MRITNLLVAALLFGISAVARAEMVYDNLSAPHDGGGFWNSDKDMMAAQPFYLGHHDAVNSVTLGLFGRGNPDGTMYLDLHNDNGGKPGSLVGRLGTLDPMSVATGRKDEYLFDTPISGLTPESMYHLVLWHDGMWTDHPNRGDRVFWSMTTRPGSAEIPEGLAIDPIVGVDDWHTVRNFPGGGPPFSLWFFASVNAALEAVNNGDFDQDGLYTANDIDLLSEAIRDSLNDLSFDINSDGQVNEDDRRFWVKDITVSNTYFGDANLDGQFDSGDLTMVFQAAKFERNEDAGWAEGDWTGDARFNTSDLTVAFQDGGYEKGPLTEVAAVPEPSTAILLTMGIIGVCRFRKSR